MLSSPCCRDTRDDSMEASGKGIQKVADLDPGRLRGSDPLALKWFQAGGRTIFVRPQDWDHDTAGLPGPAGGRRPPEGGLAGALLRDWRRARDMAALACLGQHHYLTTTHLQALLSERLRTAQRISRKLEEWGLVTR